MTHSNDPKLESNFKLCGMHSKHFQKGFSLHAEFCFMKL